MNKIIKLNLLALFLLTLVCFNGNAQENIIKDNVWKTLSKISYKKEYDEYMGFKIDKPLFSEEVKALEGKEVSLKGYIIPLEGYKSHKEFIFSAFPYASCFFCGAAGPETIMEVEAVEGIKYTDDPIVIKGILHLNGKDINKLMYKITKVKKVK